MLAEERRVGGGQERGVANDDGEGRVGEEAVRGEGCGAVVEVPRPAQGVRREGGYVRVAGGGT